MNPRKRYTTLALFFILFPFTQHLYSQVSTYTFASSSGTFSTIVGGPGTAVVTNTADDDNYGTYPIGFTFTFNGNDYTTFGINANGFISMGYVPVTTNNALSSGLNNNIISAFNNDLYGVSSSGAQISYQSSGSVGSRILTVEWSNWGFFSTGLNEFTFQIRLYETSNKIQVVFGSCPGSTSKTLQVGLRGQSNADFNNRTTTTNWSATTAGSANNATCTFNSTVKPATGLTFEWTPPPPAPRAIGTIAAVQQTGTAAPGTVSNTILRLDIPVTGATGDLTLNAISVASKNTSDNDVATGGVKVWSGTSAGPVTQLGSGASFSGGTATVSGLSYNLITGTNYVWITYDLKITAVVANTLDAKINAGGITITASGGASNPGTQPSVALNPTGAKTVNYCTPISTLGSCGGDQIGAFSLGGINYSSGACLASPGYLDVATTGTLTQGQTAGFSISLGDINDYAQMWIDYNDNASFDDTGELIFSGGPSTSYSSNITVPVSATAGTHRVRIRSTYNGLADNSCSTVTYGETKDFRLTVNQATNCSGTPASSTALASSNPVCAGVPFTLSLSTLYLNLGITYQWQSSSNGSVYSNISGATSFTYTATQSAATYYRCKVTCTNSGQTATSTAVQVNMNPFTTCVCVPTGGDCTEDYISSVAFGGISNTSTCSANAFGDYTGMTATAAQGTAVPISVGVSNGGTEFVDAWIDYNHDAVFADNERTAVGSGFNQVINGSIIVPPDALTGVTRMRVRLQFAFEPSDPCATYDYSETEDYLVNITTCSGLTYFLDADGDGYGNPNNSTVACTPPNGYVSNNLDCNDANAAIKPGAVEICNNVDDNCDGQTDEGVKLTFYADADGDTYGNAAVTTLACIAPSGYVSNNTDCNDNNASVKPGATEVCNNIDDNCNAQTDEGVKLTFYADADNDTYGNTAVTTLACSAPSGYVSNNTDCNDGNASVNPAAIEICNNIDDNCNTLIDDGAVLLATISPSGNVGICTGSNITLQANTGVGYTYQWKKDGVSISGATQSTYVASVAASYTVVISSGSCTGTSSATVITVNALPTATVTPSGTTQVCPGVVVTFQANTGVGLTYQWKNTNGNISGATASSYSTAVKSSYSVIVTNSGNCSKTSATSKLSNYAAASVKITNTGSLNICTTGSVTLNAKLVSGYTYKWFKDAVQIPGATQSSYVATIPGTYYYQATTLNGCTKNSTNKVVKGCKMGDEENTDAVPSVLLYPNPTDGEFVMEAELNEDVNESARIIIYNTMGQSVWTGECGVENGNIRTAISLYDAEEGTYLVRIITPGQTLSARLVIQR